MFVEVLVHGNHTPSDAMQMSAILEKSFEGTRSLLKSQLVRDREVQLDPNSNYFHQVNTDVHKGSCIEFLLQCGIEDTRYSRHSVIGHVQ